MIFIKNGSHALELTISNIKELVTNDLYEIKPYLRPMSSMTEEESIKYITLTHYNTDDNGKPYRELTVETLDWLLSNHFDFRGVIPMGLAIDSTGLNIY